MLYLNSIFKLAALSAMLQIIPSAAYPAATSYDEELIDPSLNATTTQIESRSPQKALDKAFFATVYALAGAVGRKTLREKFGYTGPNCCDNALSSCRYNIGTSVAGNKWMACYDEGKDKVFDFDVEAMKCNIHLHHVQATRCISIKGQPCSPNYGGGLMRGQGGYWGKQGEHDRLTAEESQTMQAAAVSMTNVLHDHSKGAAITLYTISNKNGAMMKSIDFVGHKGKEC